MARGLWRVLARSTWVCTRGDAWARARACPPALTRALASAAAAAPLPPRPPAQSSDGLHAHLDGLARALYDDVPRHAAAIGASLLEASRCLPHKASLYGTLAGLLNAADAEWCGATRRVGAWAARVRAARVRAARACARVHAADAGGTRSPLPLFKTDPRTASPRPRAPAAQGRRLCAPSL
jgi:hypothetical protein